MLTGGRLPAACAPALPADTLPPPPPQLPLNGGTTLKADPSLLALMHQLITAKLNQLAGAPVPSVVGTAIGQADTLIGGRRVLCATTPCQLWESSSLTGVAGVSDVISILDCYNNGGDPTITACIMTGIDPTVLEGWPDHCTDAQEKVRMLYACDAVFPACANVEDVAAHTACCLDAFY